MQVLHSLLLIENEQEVPCSLKIMVKWLVPPVSPETNFYAFSLQQSGSNKQLELQICKLVPLTGLRVCKVSFYQQHLLTVV